MAMVNSKSIRKALQQFVKDNGREPTFKEFSALVTGRSVKKVKK